MKTYTVIAHFSHSVFFTVEAKSAEHAKLIVEENQFLPDSDSYKWADGNYEELLSIEEPERIK